MAATDQQQSTSEILELAENTGQVIRALAGVSGSDPFDPLEHLKALDIQLMWSDELEGVAAADVAQFASVSAKTWSGTSFPVPSGHPQLVLLNRHQTIERARVTLLEEVAHRVLGHRPSSVGAGVGRTYSELNEKQAYWSGAASLLPSGVVARAVWRGETAEALAARFGSSTELAEMRIKLLGLWAQHLNNSTKNGPTS